VFITRGIGLKSFLSQDRCTLHVLRCRLNDTQDYFGRTVNIAARVQGLASSRAIHVTKSVVEDPNAAKILETSGLKPTMRRASLRGIIDETTVYEIP
jgi:class 3 adenylate cyclase